MVNVEAWAIDLDDVRNNLPLDLEEGISRAKEMRSSKAPFMNMHNVTILSMVGLWRFELV